MPVLCVHFDEKSAQTAARMLYEERFRHGAVVNILLTDVTEYAHQMIEEQILQYVPAIGLVQETATPLMVAQDLQFIREVCTE